MSGGNMKYSYNVFLEFSKRLFYKIELRTTVECHQKAYEWNKRGPKTDLCEAPHRTGRAV